MHEQVIHRHDKLDHNMPPALLAQSYHNDPVIQDLLLCLDKK